MAMAKPRVFISSTYNDLKYVREHLGEFISSIGYEPVLFERGDIAFAHNVPLDESCYKAVDEADLFVLLIGRRYGSPSSATKLASKLVGGAQEGHGEKHQSYQSITEAEYQRARENNIPIYTFVEKRVAGEFETYLRNKGRTLDWAHVENDAVFKLLESIRNADPNNFIWEFDSLTRIPDLLRGQWAGLLAELLKQKKLAPESEGLTATSTPNTTPRGGATPKGVLLVAPLVTATNGYISRFFLTQTAAETVTFVASVRNAAGLVTGGTLTGQLVSGCVTQLTLSTLLPADTSDFPGPYQVEFNIAVEANAVHGTYAKTAPSGVVETQPMNLVQSLKLKQF